VANDLTNPLEIALKRFGGNDEFGLETFEFSGPASYLALVGLPRQEIALFECLIAILVDISTEPAEFDGLRRWISEPAKLTASPHVIEHWISRVVRCCHGLVQQVKLSTAADCHRLGCGIGVAVKVTATGPSGGML
jgi:hypothetical protein